MRATISLLGLYNYDNSILDGLTLPSNFTSDELAALKSNLLMETAEFELLYSNFDFLKYAITQWCEKRKPTWEELRKALMLNYNPLENVDMHLEDHTGSKLEKDIVTDFERKLKTAKTGHDDFDQDVKKTGTDDFDQDVKKTGHDDIENTDKKTGDDTLLHSVYAYNDNSNGALESGDKTTYNSQIKSDGKTTYNNTINTDATTTYNSNVNTDATTTYANTVDETGTTKNTVDHDEQLKRNYSKDWHGRDHVTAQELIKEQMDIAMFNMLDFIINDFKKRFCLLVY